MKRDSIHRYIIIGSILCSPGLLHAMGASAVPTGNAACTISTTHQQSPVTNDSVQYSLHSSKAEKNHVQQQLQAMPASGTSAQLAPGIFANLQTTQPATNLCVVLLGSLQKNTHKYTRMPEKVFTAPQGPFDE